MNKIIVISVFGIVLLLIALGLNFWLNPFSETEIAVAPSMMEDAQTNAQGMRAVTSTSKSPPPKPAEPKSEEPKSEEPKPAEPKSEVTESKAPEPLTPARTPPKNTVINSADQPTGQADSDAPKVDITSLDQKGAPKPIAEPIAEKPRFDIVRLNEAGDAVIAGQAEPKSEVLLLDNDQVLGQAVADDKGAWVMMPEKSLEAGDHTLTLKSSDGRGKDMTSDQVVVLVVPPKDQIKPQDQPKPKDQPKNLGEVALQKEAIDPKPQPLAVLIENTESGEVSILQKPEPEDKITMTYPLRIEQIDYDEKGQVVIAGIGVAGADIILYLDNISIARTAVGETDNWRAQPTEKIAPGLYKMRADQLVAGKVVSRIEIPFQRATLAEIIPEEQIPLPPSSPSVADARKQVKPDLAPTKVTKPLQVIVQPGNSLWRIARANLERGTRYVEIYQLNQSQIRDPDLIYPGQIFTLPDQQ